MKYTLLQGQEVYRISDHLVSVTVDADLELYASKPEIYIEKWKVKKVTQQGAWLTRGFCKKFMRTDCKKKFAHPTVAAAWESFKIRKSIQISILEKRISNIRMAIDIGNALNLHQE